MCYRRAAISALDRRLQTVLCCGTQSSDLGCQPWIPVIPALSAAAVSESQSLCPSWFAASICSASPSKNAPPLSHSIFMDAATLRSITCRRTPGSRSNWRGALSFTMYGHESHGFRGRIRFGSSSKSQLNWKHPATYGRSNRHRRIGLPKRLQLARTRALLPRTRICGAPSASKKGNGSNDIYGFQGKTNGRYDRQDERAGNSIWGCRDGRASADSRTRGELERRARQAADEAAAQANEQVRRTAEEAERNKLPHRKSSSGNGRKNSSKYKRASSNRSLLNWHPSRANCLPG